MLLYRRWVSSARCCSRGVNDKYNTWCYSRRVTECQYDTRCYIKCTTEGQNNTGYTMRVTETRCNPWWYTKRVTSVSCCMVSDENGQLIDDIWGLWHTLGQLTWKSLRSDSSHRYLSQKHSRRPIRSDPSDTQVVKKHIYPIRSDPSDTQVVDSCATASPLIALVIS